MGEGSPIATSILKSAGLIGIGAGVALASTKYEKGIRSQLRRWSLIKASESDHTIETGCDPIEQERRVTINEATSAMAFEFNTNRARNESGRGRMSSHNTMYTAPLWENKYKEQGHGIQKSIDPTKMENWPTNYMANCEPVPYQHIPQSVLAPCCDSRDMRTEAQLFYDNMVQSGVCNKEKNLASGQGVAQLLFDAGKQHFSNNSQITGITSFKDVLAVCDYPQTFYKEIRKCFKSQGADHLATILKMDSEVQCILAQRKDPDGTVFSDSNEDTASESNCSGSDTERKQPKQAVKRSGKRKSKKKKKKCESDEDDTKDSEDQIMKGCPLAAKKDPFSIQDIVEQRKAAQVADKTQVDCNQQPGTKIPSQPESNCDDSNQRQNQPTQCIPCQMPKQCIAAVTPVANNMPQQTQIPCIPNQVSNQIQDATAPQMYNSAPQEKQLTNMYNPQQAMSEPNQMEEQYLENTTPEMYAAALQQAQQLSQSQLNGQDKISQGHQAYAQSMSTMYDKAQTPGLQSIMQINQHMSREQYIGGNQPELAVENDGYYPTLQEGMTGESQNQLEYMGNQGISISQIEFVDNEGNVYVAKADADGNIQQFQDQEGYIDYQPSMFQEMGGQMTPPTQSEDALQDQHSQYQGQYYTESQMGRVVESQTGATVGQGVPSQINAQSDNALSNKGTRSVSKIQSQTQYRQNPQMSAISMFQGGQTPLAQSQTDNSPRAQYAADKTGTGNKFDTIAEEQSAMIASVNDDRASNMQVETRQSEKIVIDYSAKDGVEPPQSGIADVEFEEDDDPQATFREIDPDAMSIVQHVYTAPELDYENQLEAIQEDETAENENGYGNLEGYIPNNQRPFGQPSMFQQAETPQNFSTTGANISQNYRVPSVMQQPMTQSRYDAAPGASDVNAAARGPFGVPSMMQQAKTPPSQSVHQGVYRSESKGGRTESRYNATTMKDGHTLPTPSRLNALSGWSGPQQDPSVIMGQSSVVSAFQVPPIITQQPSPESQNHMVTNDPRSRGMTQSTMDTLQVKKRGRSKSPNSRTAQNRQKGAGERKQMPSNFSMQSNSQGKPYSRIQAQGKPQIPGNYSSMGPQSGSRAQSESQYSVMIQSNTRTPPNISQHSAISPSNRVQKRPQSESQYSVMIQQNTRTPPNLSQHSVANPTNRGTTNLRNAGNASQYSVSTGAKVRPGQINNRIQNASQYSVMMPGNTATPPNASQFSINQRAEIVNGNPSSRNSRTQSPSQYSVMTGGNRAQNNASQYSVYNPGKSQINRFDREPGTPQSTSQHHVPVQQNTSPAGRLQKRAPQSPSVYSVMIQGNVPQNRFNVPVKQNGITPYNASQQSVFIQGAPARQEPGTPKSGSQYMIVSQKNMQQGHNRANNRPFNPSQYSVMIQNNPSMKHESNTPQNRSVMSMNQPIGNAQRIPKQSGRGQSASQYSVAAQGKTTQRPNQSKTPVAQSRTASQNPSQYSVFQQPNSPRAVVAPIKEEPGTPLSASQYSVVPQTQHPTVMSEKRATQEGKTQQQPQGRSSMPSRQSVADQGRNSTQAGVSDVPPPKRQSVVQPVINSTQMENQPSMQATESSPNRHSVAEQRQSASQEGEATPAATADMTSPPVGNGSAPNQQPDMSEDDPFLYPTQDKPYVESTKIPSTHRIFHPWEEPLRRPSAGPTEQEPEQLVAPPDGTNDHSRSPSPVNPVSSGKEQDTYQSLSSEPPSEADADFQMVSSEAPEPINTEGEKLEDDAGPIRQAVTPEPGE